MTAQTRSAAAVVAARLLAAAAMVTTALGPLLVGLELLLAPPAASSFTPNGMHMPGGVDSEISFRAGVMVATAAVGVLLALAARGLARGDRTVRRALQASAVVLVASVLLGPLAVRALWLAAGVIGGR